MCAANLLSQRTRLVEPPAPLLLFSSPCLRLAFALALAFLLSFPQGICFCRCPCLCCCPCPCFCFFGCHSRRESAFAFAFALAVALAVALALALAFALAFAFAFWLSFPQGICLFSRSQQTPPTTNGSTANPCGDPRPQEQHAASVKCMVCGKHIQRHDFKANKNFAKMAGNFP